MHVDPIPVALIGTGIGIALCTHALLLESGKSALDSCNLMLFAGTGLILFLVLGCIQVGVGSLTGLSLEELLAFDSTIHYRKPALLLTMWASLGASIELFLAGIWTNLRKWFERRDGRT
jgi:hypothetical protein